jgi:hypothetical protein
LKPEYWLITDSFTVQWNTGTVWSLFIWKIYPKTVLSTSWRFCSGAGGRSSRE